MRIGWAAPWNTNSAVAQSAGEVAFELAARGHEVCVLRTEVGDCLDLPARPAPGRLLALDDLSDEEIVRSFDVVVAHFGDHYGFHGALLPRLDSIDVVGIFHDACIPHLIRGWTGGDDPLLRSLVAEIYGEQVAQGPLHWNDLASIARGYPMIEWVARRTVGAVAHAHHYADRLRSVCPGPVVVTPLAFKVDNLPPPPPPWTRTQIAVVGHANSNKLIDQLILAISASHLLRHHCRLRIVGSAEPTERQRLTRLAEVVGINGPEFTGWVSDEDLRWQLRDVDVMSCLRNPVFEGASASLVLALTSGRPTLIVDHGCYAEVPHDAALVCRPGGEALDIMRNLEHIVSHPETGRAMGEKARAFVKTRHSAPVYVDALLPMLQQVAAARPMNQARLTLGNILGSFGLGAADPAMARMAAAVAGITPAAATPN